jgi:hypothetical protein
MKEETITERKAPGPLPLVEMMVTGLNQIASGQLTNELGQFVE